MPFRQDRTAGYQADINMTPLIDVMLALVVVFMIAAPLVMKRFTLPIGDSPTSAPSVEPVRLHVGSDGALTWNGERLSPALLNEQLRLTALRVPQPPLRIEIDRGAAYRSFASVLADAKAAHIEAIGVLDTR